MLEKKVYKVLITGSFGSGKTTLVKNLSEIDPLLTEKKISSPQERSQEKVTTTVAMDMGKITVGDALEIHLFSTPGQSRFDFMVDLLKRGIIGAIILVDASNPRSVREALEVADKIRKTHDVPIVFAVTKLDLPGAKSFDEIKALLSGDDYSSVLPVDPRKKEDGKRALTELLSLALN